ncbi:la-related protein 6-like [Centruroides sculpturatus]|uniref:la-related protein 6-like n=1 Tax=Centruroides sculpturatus TaxID=218467 RepID=UPI000C6D93F9|nr:la-related protein 6-like [Centruroides sculpturatus]
MSEEILVTTSDSDRENINEFIVPDGDLTKKIVDLIEFYFSNENVLKDKFLLKHLKRNKEGYVSIKLMTSYRKVKTLTRNWQVVAYSLNTSEMLEVNAEGTRVRRKEPLPELEQPVCSKSVLACDLPFHKATVEKVGGLFSSCGEIALLQILRPGGNVPENVRKLSCKHPNLLKNVCALIEFENELSAQKSLQVKDVRVLPLPESETCKNKRRKPKSKPKDIIISRNEIHSGYRSSSVSSGYLSTSPRRGSDCDSRCNSPVLTTNFSRRYTLPTVVNQNRRENRLELISEHKISNYILRLPKGPDDTKGFRSRKVVVRGSF